MNSIELSQLVLFIYGHKVATEEHLKFLVILICLTFKDKDRFNVHSGQFLKVVARCEKLVTCLQYINIVHMN